MIYHQLLAWHHCERGDNRLYEQPAITRVSRQLRAEALTLYCASPIFLQIKGESPLDWVLLIQQVVDEFTGGRGGPPGSSTLRLLGDIQLDFFCTRYGIHIEIDLAAGPTNLVARAVGLPRGGVIVGRTALGWTDAITLRAACDKAAILLDGKLMSNMIPRGIEGESLPFSNMFRQRDALDALCAFALACPHPTHALVRVKAPVLSVATKNRWPIVRRRLLRSMSE